MRPVASLAPLSTSRTNHYAALGLDRHCTDAQIRDAYRLLAKQHHPDLNGGSRASVAQTQQLNAAYEILSDPERRRAHDLELDARQKPAARAARTSANITQDVHLRLDEFFRGTSLELRVNDPGNAATAEIYPFPKPRRAPAFACHERTEAWLLSA